MNVAVDWGVKNQTLQKLSTDTLAAEEIMKDSVDPDKVAASEAS